ncbi:MAG TPA: TetR/AcrR family transcriptional regulator [Solirubrobacterales bacterium]|nr:TetR/AcrR family transcriptional regulator [Solirubrobacterales bacterium]
MSKLPPGRHRLPRHFVEQNQRNRILLAGLNSFGTRRYTEVSVKDLVVEAHLSRATYYKYFPDRETCLAAVYEEVVSWIRDSLRDGPAESGPWPSRVRSATERIVAILAEDRRLARICALEAPLGPEKVRVRHERELGDLAALLRAGRRESPWGSRLPDSLETLLLAGAVSLVGRALVLEGGPSEELGTVIAEILLVPYVGGADASRLVGRD